MTQRQREESLEALEERIERGWAREDEDQEVALEELIEALVRAERTTDPPAPEERRSDEFTCSWCRLIRSRTCLADDARMICEDCAAEERRGPRPTVRHRPRVETPCPACGSVVMVPERDDVACGFFCPQCGAHIMRRGGHLHLVWDHRYRPDHLAVRQEPSREDRR
ncbi:MAG: DUF4193 family protein [Actinomycetota bacterium]